MKLKNDIFNLPGSLLMTGHRVRALLIWDGVEKVLKRFKEMGFRIRNYPPRKDRRRKPRRKLPDNVIQLMTKEQKIKLGHLRKDMGLTTRGYENLCFRALGKHKPLIVQDAQEMIEAMKAILKRRSS